LYLSTSGSFPKKLATSKIMLDKKGEEPFFYLRLLVEI
jgi:hypothetical protein